MKKFMRKFWIYVKYVCSLVLSFCGGYGAGTLANQAKTKLGKIMGWLVLVPAALVGGFYAGDAIGMKVEDDLHKEFLNDLKEEYENDSEENE